MPKLLPCIKTHLLIHHVKQKIHIGPKISDSKTSHGIYLYKDILIIIPTTYP